MDIQSVKKNSKPVSSLLKALSNEKRLMIVCALFDQEKSVGELENIVDLSQSALSQHLARLRHDEVVTTRREAQTIFYSIKCDVTKQLLSSMCDIFCNR